ncbi:MAG: hypothetical protein K6E75_04395 [Lachnospiraceae bacterium]|nr:hypothetical protein [Lachnospiraceae bacterium]
MRDGKWIKRTAGCVCCLALVLLCVLSTGVARKNDGEISDGSSDTETAKETDGGDSSEEALWEEGRAGGLEEVTAGLASHIVADTFGYNADDEKTAYFYGGSQGAVFYVVREDDKSIAYEGTLEKADEQDIAIERPESEIISGGDICRGDFTSLDKPGTYYIQTPVIGQSESFKIAEDLYGEIADTCFAGWREKSGLFDGEADLPDETLEDDAKSLFLLSVCAGMHPSFWEKYRKDLIDAAGRLSDSYHAEKEDTDREIGGSVGDGAYVAAMAELANVLRTYEEPEDLIQRYSGEALAAYETVSAEGIVEEDGNNERRENEENGENAEIGDNSGDEEKAEIRENAEHDDGGIRDSETQIAAQAALLKLIGEDRFKEPVEEYLTGNVDWDEKSFPAIWCYLTTPKVTDVEICDRLMDALLQRTGRIADGDGTGDKATDTADTADVADITDIADAGSDVDAAKEKEPVAQAFFDMQLLSLADYVIVSREYRECCRRIYREQIAESKTSAIQDAQIVFSLCHEE